MKRGRIGIITSRGGHLYQMYKLRPFWSRYDRFWVTFPGVDTDTLLQGERLYYGFPPDTRNIINALRHLVLAVKILSAERPTAIISCGAGIAPPFFYIAKLFGIKTMYIEVYDFIAFPTMTARMIAPIADVMLVQHESQKKFFPNAVYKGAIL